MLHRLIRSGVRRLNWALTKSHRSDAPHADVSRRHVEGPTNKKI